MAGRLRRAGADQRDQLVRWWRGFYAEAEPLHPDDAERDVAARYGDRSLYVWEDGGEPVSLICGRLTGNGYGWIGPVYTPPERRRRGYAAAGVAADQPSAARCGCVTVPPVYRPRQPDLEQDLP